MLQKWLQACDVKCSLPAFFFSPPLSEKIAQITLDGDMLAVHDKDAK